MSLFGVIQKTNRSSTGLKMSVSDFEGVFPYLVSPVKPSGDIDELILTQLCNDLIEAGVHGLTPLGSTGEFAYLSPQPLSDSGIVEVRAALERIGAL